MFIGRQRELGELERISSVRTITNSQKQAQKIGRSVLLYAMIY